MSSTQQAILAATRAANLERNRYSEAQVRMFRQLLTAAEGQVKTLLMRRYSNSASKPTASIQALLGQVDSILQRLNHEQNLAFRKITPEAFRGGIHRSLTELAAARFPGLKDTDESERESLSDRLFSQIDTNALDFLVRYNLTLAGDVNQELRGQIKRTLFLALVNGQSLKNTLDQLGQVIADPTSFRRAGKKVFSKAQYRLELIVRTETLRAHNQGRLKAYQAMDVQKGTWLTNADERVCSRCGPLDGKDYDLKELPNQPLHPNCRCTFVAKI